MKGQWSPWHSRLGTFIDRLRVDFNGHRITIWLPGGCCVDMTRTIDLAVWLDPQVVEIETLSAEEADTFYSRRPDGTWHAINFK